MPEHRIRTTSGPVDYALVLLSRMLNMTSSDLSFFR